MQPWRSWPDADDATGPFLLDGASRLLDRHGFARALSRAGVGRNSLMCRVPGKILGPRSQNYGGLEATKLIYPGIVK